MRKVYKGILVVIALISLASAQPKTDLLLAYRFYDNKEFDKSLVFFEKLYQQDALQHIHYKVFTELLILYDRHEEAQEILKKRIKKEKKVIEYLFYLSEATRELSEKEKIYQRIIDKIPKQDTAVKNVFNFFITQKQLEYAEKALKKGEAYGYKEALATEFAILYEKQGVYDQMIVHYLDVALRYPFYYDRIISNLNNFFFQNNDDKEHIRLLGKKLHEYGLKHPYHKELNRMQLWYYLKAQAYEDVTRFFSDPKRVKLMGNKQVYTFLQNLLKNKQYQITRSVVENLLRETPQDRALQKLKLQAQYSTMSSLEEKEEVERAYLSYFERYNYQVDVALILQLISYYQQEKPDTVQPYIVFLLEKEIEPSTKGRLYISYGQMLQKRGDYWAATIQYQQAASLNPNTEIMREADYLTAKSAFMVQQFDWSKRKSEELLPYSQSMYNNDAFHFIWLLELYEENKSDLQKLSLSMKMEEEGKYDSAEFFLSELSQHPDVRGLLLFRLYTRSANKNKANAMLNGLLRISEASIIRDQILFYAAEYAFSEGNSVKANEYILFLLKEYPGSFFAKKGQLLREQHVLKI